MAATSGTGGRTARRVVIGVIITLVILVGLDRLGDFIAEQAAATTLQNSQHLREQPDVSIDGFPFLTQLATGDFDKITATVSDITVGNAALSVRMARLRVVLRSVTVARDLSSVRAGRADADGLITYADLGKPVSADISYAGGGRVKVGKSVTVLGTTVSGSLTVAPALVDGALTLGRISTNGLGGVARAIREALDVPLPLNGIPFGITVRTLSAQPDGIHVGLSGANLTYRR